MKISNANYPILKMLYNNNYDKYAPRLINKLDIDAIAEINFISEFKRLNSTFKETIFKPSHSFLTAIDKCQHKLLNIVDDYMKNAYNDLQINGTYIIRSTVFMASIESTSLTTKKAIFHLFTSLGIPVLRVTINYDLISIEKSTTELWVSKKIHDYVKENKIENKDIGWQLVTETVNVCSLIAVFKKHADVELKEVEGMSKKKHEHGVYINDTNLKITYLDSKWFTTLVKSDGFKVSGHFRLQPYKLDGKWDLKLIYINEFQKSGYTAPARKLIQSYI